jgi:hypothetical protein
VVLASQLSGQSIYARYLNPAAHGTPLAEKFDPDFWCESIELTAATCRERQADFLHKRAKNRRRHGAGLSLDCPRLIDRALSDSQGE